MYFRTVAIALFALCFAAMPTFADDICFNRGGQYADLRHCVTSVRAAQGDVKFGPDNLAATSDGAWCANAERNQKVTMYLKPAAPLRTVNIVNGYAKSNETYRQNGRIKRAVIETNTGYQGYIDLKDTTAVQSFIIPKGTYAWVRLTILETARGNQNPNVCLSEFLVNLEELGNN